MVRRRVYGGEVDLPKSGKAREIVLLPEARDALLSVPRDGERIFRAKRGGDLSASTLAYYWQAISAVFGPVDPHELRHFAGHHLYVTLGLPARVVAVQLGHSSPRLVEELYGHGDVGALEEIDRALGEKRRAAAAGGGRMSQTPGRHLGRSMPLYEAKLQQSPRLSRNRTATRSCSRRSARAQSCAVVTVAWW